jgi:surfeit locus 1 family protein
VSRRLAPLLALAALAFAVLVGLGVWQVERLHWKEDLLARIESRRHAAPAPLPPRAEWAALRPDDVDYRHVAASGTWMPDASVLVFRASAPDGRGGEGPGYLVLTPLRLDGGGIVVVNRGFVPLAEAAVLPGLPASATALRGLMRPPESRNPFTPKDDPGRNQWFTRDPFTIASAKGLSDVAPFTIDREAETGDPQWPRGGQTVLDIPNNHLSYALTWFGLAAALAGVLIAYVWAYIRRGRR